MKETLALFEALLTLAVLVTAATLVPWLVVIVGPVGLAILSRTDGKPSRPF